MIIFSKVVYDIENIYCTFEYRKSNLNKIFIYIFNKTLRNKDLLLTHIGY